MLVFKYSAPAMGVQWPVHRISAPANAVNRNRSETVLDNKTALFLALLILSVFVADHFWLHLDLPMFLMTKLSELIDKIAFWR